MSNINTDNTVFIEQEMNLENVVEFQQYLYKNKLIYIMGERDFERVNCHRPITISQFVLTPLLTNPNSDFAIEYSTRLINNNYPQGTSLNVREILTNVDNLTILNDAKNRIKHIDFRREFLPTQHYRFQDVTSFLYYGYKQNYPRTSNSLLYYITFKELKEAILDPFFDHNNQLKFLSMSNYVEPNIAQAIHEYKSHIYNYAEKLQKKMENELNREPKINELKKEAEKAAKNNYVGLTREMKEYLKQFDYHKYNTELVQLKIKYIEKLQTIWDFVNDSLCLPIIFDTRQTQTFILVGFSHSRNFKKILSAFNKDYNIPIEMLIDSQSLDACIKILKPVNIYNENLQDTLGNLTSSEELRTADESEALFGLLLMQQQQGQHQLQL